MGALPESVPALWHHNRPFPSVQGMKMLLRHLAPSLGGRSRQAPMHPCSPLGFRLGFTLSAFHSSLPALPETLLCFPPPGQQEDE